MLLADGERDVVVDGREAAAASKDEMEHVRLLRNAIRVVLRR